MFQRPGVSEFAAFQKKYIELVPDDVMPYLKDQRSSFKEYIENIQSEKLNYRYAEGKWNIREVIMHIVDTERVFAYRTLALSRGDKERLPNFDQDQYINSFNTDHLDTPYLSKYFSTTRDSSLALFEGFASDQWNIIGHMSNYSMKMTAIPYMLAGHLDHHLAILKERY